MSACPKCGAPARHMPPDGDFRYDPPRKSQTTVIAELRAEVERLQHEVESAGALRLRMEALKQGREAAERAFAEARREIERLRGKTADALDAAGYYVDRLRTVHAGRTVRDLDEAGEAYYRLSGEARLAAAEAALALIREEVAKDNAPLGRSDSMALSRIRTVLGVSDHD